MEKQKLWTKDYIISCTVNFILSVIFFLLMVTMSVYAVEKFHANTSEAGLVTGIFIIGTLLGRVAGGTYIEKVGRKRFLIWGLLFYTLFMFFYLLIDNLYFLLINRLLHGITNGIASTCIGTIVAYKIPYNRYGEGIGYYSSSGILGLAIGPFLGIYLSGYFNITSIIIICIFLSLGVFGTALLIKVTTNVSTARQKKNEKINLRNVIEYRAVPIATITALTGICYSSILSFISFYGEELNLVKASSYFFLVYVIMNLISRPFVGALLDKKGENMVIYPAMLIFAVGMFLLSQVYHSWTVLLAAAFVGLGYGNFSSSAQAVCLKVTPPERLGLATSTHYFFLEIGLGLGPYLVGFMIQILGYRYLYMSMAIMILLITVLYFFLHGRKTKEYLLNHVQHSK